MNIMGSWYQVRRDLEAALDRLFMLPSEDFVEFDSLLSVEELDALGYVRNFPHLTCLMCSIDEGDLHSFSREARQLSAGYAPSSTRMGLLPATCYKIYLHLQGQTLPAPRIVGCIARCFRHEDKPLDRYRGFNFTMKEFVCLGQPEDARRHVDDGAARIDRLMAALNIPFTFETASDPFFDMSSSVAILSKASPTKREVVVGGHAIASLNAHRNYFGGKFGIRLGGSPVHTSCVAFGLERWIAMLQERFASPEAARARLAEIAPAEPAVANVA